MSEQLDDIPDLLRLAQQRGLGEQVFPLLNAYRAECQKALNWQRLAGRALAAEGLETDVFEREIRAWIGRARESLRSAVVALLR